MAEFNLANYDIMQAIGAGCYGCVYEGRRKSDCTPVAIKIIRKNNVEWKSSGNVPCEVTMLMKCQHLPGVIKLIEYFEKDGYIHIVQEKSTEATHLGLYIGKHGPLNEDHAKEIFIQIAKSVLGIHKAGVVHGDLKCENVLVDRSSRTVKIIDFGSAFPVHENPLHMESAAGLPRRPPTMSGDNWAVGMMLSFMLCGSSVEGFESDKLSVEAKDLVKSWLNRKPEEQFTLEQILEHEWLK